jgi:PAS domain S-box-containing protein
VAPGPVNRRGVRGTATTAPWIRSLRGAKMRTFRVLQGRGCWVDVGTSPLRSSDAMGAADTRLPGVGRGALERARLRLIAHRLPRFAGAWLLLSALWRITLAAGGRLSVVSAVLGFAALAALVLVAAQVCRTDPVARRVRPIALGTCLVLGAANTILTLQTGGSREGLGFVLSTVSISAAIIFGWGWWWASALVVAFVATWASAAPFLASLLRPVESTVGVAVAAGVSVAAAELYARSFAESWRQRRQKRRALRKLAASHQAYRDLAENAPALIYTVDVDGRLTYVNAAFVKSAGSPAAELIGRSVYDMVLKGRENPDLHAVTARLVAGERLPPQLVAVGPVEAPRIFECVATAIRDATGRITSVNGIAHDVTDRVRAERARAERGRIDAFSAEVATTLASDAPLETILQRCTEAMVAHLGAALARVWLMGEGQALELEASAGGHTHLDGAHGRIPVGTLEIGLIAKERTPYVTNAVIGDPRVHDQEWAARTGMVAFAGYPILLGEQVLGVVGMFARDALGTEVLAALAAAANALALGIDRKRAETALRMSVEELRRRQLDLRRLAQRQATIREEERKRVSFDLHDDVCQDLVGVSILLESLRGRLAPLHPKVAAQFQRVGQCLADVIDHMRILARDLRPVLLRELGLEEGLRSLTKGAESGRATMRIVCPTPIPPLDEDTEIGLYRIAQEALANAQRHANAREVVVTLTVEEDTLRLEVRDDGCGFVPEEQRRSGGLGLLSIEERALALGGQLSVSSRPGAGTTIHLEYPLVRTPATAA